MSFSGNLETPKPQHFPSALTVVKSLNLAMTNLPDYFWEKLKTMENKSSPIKLVTRSEIFYFFTSS